MRIERWLPFDVTPSRWQPQSGMAGIQHEMNRLFDDFFGRPATAENVQRMWSPLSDMWETKEEIGVAFELPGVHEGDVNVSITGDVLTVRGERKWQRPVNDETLHRVERVYGKFERSVPLPIAVQTDKVKATFRDGILEIRMPKVEAVRPKEIKINVQ